MPQTLRPGKCGPIQPPGLLDVAQLPFNGVDVALMKLRQTIHHLLIGAGSVLAPGAAPAASSPAPLFSIARDFRAAGVAIQYALQAAKKENGPPRPARQLEFEEIALAGRGR